MEQCARRPLTRRHHFPQHTAFLLREGNAKFGHGKSPSPQTTLRSEKENRPGSTCQSKIAKLLGVGIGFGLQTIVNNFVCGLILLLERPLRVGDTIELGGQLAKIAKIGLRSTTVRTADQADMIVPNAELITNRVTNWTLTNRQARSII